MKTPIIDHYTTPASRVNMDEARLAGMMNDASIDQILALDTGLRIVAWNRACEEITGIARSAAIGKTFVDVHPAAVNFPAIMEGIVAGMKGCKSFVPWERGAYADGYFEHHFVPLKGDDGATVGVLVIIHDVAHRIKAEKELQRLNYDLRKKTKDVLRKTQELADFNWIASHDLKEPLRKIYTFIEMVATKEGIKLTDAARSNLRRAQSAVQRMGLLTDDIVTFTQVAAPTEQLGNADLRQVLAQAIARHQRMIENDGSVIGEPPALPVIRAYPEMLRLLFYHMLGNALKFHKEGAQPKVSIRYETTTGELTGHPEAEQSATYHAIIFEDNGIGFAPVYSEKIFGLFQRLNPDGMYKGTGMGLAICRKVAEAHEGFILSRSAEGEGATFTCLLKDFDE